MDTLGPGQEPTFLDWTEMELVDLNGEGFTVSLTHSRGSRGVVIKIFSSAMMLDPDRREYVQYLKIKTRS